MTYQDLVDILSKRYSRWTVVEDHKMHSVTFYLPGEKINYFTDVELEIKRPVGITFQAKRLKWYQNWFIRQKFLIINQGILK